MDGEVGNLAGAFLKHLLSQLPQDKHASFVCMFTSYMAVQSDHTLLDIEISS